MLATLSQVDTLFYLALFVVGGVLGEGFARLRCSRTRQFIVTVLSSLLIIYLDYSSFLLLSAFSTGVLLLIRSGVNIQKYILWLSLALLGVLIVIKDYAFFIDVENPYVPLGISYYFFRLIALVIEYSKNPKQFESISTLDYFSWTFFFPIFLAGPIMRFQQYGLLDPEERKAKRFTFYATFVFALCIKFLVVDSFLFTFVYKQAYPEVTKSFADLSQGYIFLFAAAAFIHAYLDLMLYTEMSKAAARFLGFKNIENFNWPLLASNISQFWQRWHMSLSNWTRDYVFFPFLVKTKNTWIASYASMLTIGIWHAATWNWIVWALAHGTLLNLYGTWRGSRLFKGIAANSLGNFLLIILGNLITVSFVSAIFIFVAIEDFDKAYKVFFHMIGVE